MIERFSEDVDLAITSSGLNEAHAAAQAGKSRTQREKLLEALDTVARREIAEVYLVGLRERLSHSLGTTEAEGGWKLEIEAGTDDQSIAFWYPRVGAAPAAMLPYVKLEFGTRSEHEPHQERPVRPYLADALPELGLDTTTVRVLGVERTFWEKATILHALHHHPAEKILRPRMARHYYDFAQLLDHPLGQAALRQTDLLPVVAEHKALYFSSSAARFDEARLGTLKLLTKPARAAELARDYAAMSAQFFATKPRPWPEIVARIAEAEKGLGELSAG